VMFCLLLGAGMVPSRSVLEQADLVSGVVTVPVQAARSIVLSVGA
jgi:hypothetical protein